MTRALRRLYELVSERPLARKVWIVDSYASGHICVQRMARTYGPVMNLEVRTAHGAAAERAKEAMAAAAVSYAPPEETYWIVCSLLRTAAADGRWGGYVPEALATPGVAERFHRTLLELREAGVEAERLVDAAFELPEKARFLRGLLAAYEETLARHRLVDFAGMAKLAAPPANGGDETLYIVDGGLRLSAAARAMLERVAGGRVETLPPEPDFLEPASGFPFERSSFFQGLGPLSETKEALRRFAASGAAWDECELLLSDADGYSAAAYALCRRFGIDATFAHGVPPRCFQRGKAAYSYLEWLESGFRADVLAEAVAQGLLRLPEEASFGRSTAVRLLEASGIGWGRERYKALASEAYAQEGERAAAEWLDGLCRRAFAALPEAPADWSAAHVAEGLAAFLDECGPPASRGDAETAAFAAELRRVLGRWATDPVGDDAAVRAVRRRWDAFAAESDGTPQPGKLHVAPVDRGGLSGRRVTIVLGMHEDAWASTVREDPVLTDGERSRLSDELETSAERARAARQARGRRLGAVRGACAAGFSGLRLADGSTPSPAFELLQWFRAAAQAPDADFEALSAALGDPAGWGGGAAGGMLLDLDDALLRELATPERLLRDGAPVVLASFRSLADGRTAAEARMEPAIGAYDGIVGSAGAGEGAAPAGLPEAFSASKLETYAKCPLLFFFREVLGVRPKEVVEYDRTRWLDALQRGQLLHGIFYAYMSSVASGGRHDRAALDDYCEKELAKTAERIPAPSPHIYEKERESIRRDVEVFWRMEQRRRSRARWLELELHREDGAFLLDLGDGDVLPIRGIVDRIDETEPHRYKIIDYKTGQPKYYEEGSFFAGGAQLQHALYALAAEQWMRREGADPEGVVLEAAYAFPTERGLGEEALRPQAGRRDETVALLRRMLESIRGGLFPPTEKPELCRRCDYAGVCGSHAEWKKQARSFPENRERLAPLLEVNGYV
ncbi:PD-(D/E)XK nuclease family protein [Paenibacillus sp.]|uniref:PD-(D/E)XK nuclease family protein n=1 Tax=Paenibacillus sp. TaxID=58172 RepID=UPI002D5311B7|nr:PD-(D/E)XK nuclease family protein [Paenibacillus sp.]HZG57008.1 PD-(D/E)XK nuclease family protein [Paenibacillus sp.]